MENKTCVFCGVSTEDYWYSQGDTCRCRTCALNGQISTQQEAYKQERLKYIPLRGIEFFNPDFLARERNNDKKFDGGPQLLRFAVEGSLIEYKPKTKDNPIKRGWVRGDVEGFSVRSRSRLNKTIATLNKNVLPFFCTLTYHQTIPENFEGYKKHLDTFLKRLFRRFPMAGVIWKLEFQKRGFAHFHLFFFNCNFILSFLFLAKYSPTDCVRCLCGVISSY